MTGDVLTVTAAIASLPAASDFVEACAGRCGLGAPKMHAIQLALEEAFVNICRYAYPDSVGEVELSCRRAGGPFVLEIADTGIPFDVLALPEPDLTLDVMEREIGGLGVHFIRSVSDHVSCRRENGRNILRMEFLCPT